MSRLAAFGYGSLVSPQSASLTLGRPVELAGLARLRGWRRRWSVARDNCATEKTFARADDGELLSWCLGLNIDHDAGEAGPNGALIELSPAELDRLDLRELRYDRVEVGGEVFPCNEAGEALGRGHGFDAVYAWTAKPHHHAPTPPPGASVIRSYVVAVEAAFAELGPPQLELFRATTEAPPVELVDAVLVRDSIPLGNPRDW